MDEGRSTRIAIQLDSRDPLRGVVEPDGGGKPQPFVGWLGLLKVLESSLATYSKSVKPRRESLR